MPQPSYDGPERRSSGLLERHIQTGIQAILVGLVLWVGSSILVIREDVAVLRERSAQQSIRIEELNRELKSAISDRYRGSDAERDFAAVGARIKMLEDRVDSLSRRSSRNERQ